VLFGIAWSLGLAYVLTWLLVAAIWRISSLAALVAAILAPVYSLYLLGDFAVALVVAIVALLLIVRHRSNIEKLIEGREDRIGGR
jgi:glycerol-3-phosphate acyltransferase PlsY